MGGGGGGGGALSLMPDQRSAEKTNCVSHDCLLVNSMAACLAVNALEGSGHSRPDVMRYLCFRREICQAS